VGSIKKIKTMKQIISKITLASLAFMLFAACSKEPSFDYEEGTVGSSRITHFPVFEYSGKTAMSVVKGTPFTDPGVKAKEGDTEIPVTVTGSVNTAVTGFYRLDYTATNKDGFSVNTQRFVVVIANAEQPGVDVSGEYLPIGGAPSNAIITKEDQGLYFTTNCWGGGSLAVIPAYFVCLDGATVNIPQQDLGTGAGRIVTSAPGTYTAGLINWTPTRMDFPSGPLTVNKRWQKL
jgi:Domain of unknown function (DUF5011)